MKHLWNHLRFYKKETILAPLFKMMEALFDLFVPLVVARLIDRGIGGGDPAEVARCCLILCALALIGLLCSFAAQFFAARAATGCAAKLRHELFAHIQTLGASQLDGIGVSTLITRMTSDISQVQNGLNLALRLLLRSPFIVFGAMAMAFFLDAKTALIFAAILPVLSAIVILVMRRTAPGYRAIQGRLDRVTQTIRENLSGVRVVRAFGREEEETRTFQKRNEELMGQQEKVGRVSALLNPMTYVAVNLGLAAIVAVGSHRVESGVLLSGDVVALVNYMSQILVELVKLANLVVTISRASAGMSRVAAVLDTAPDQIFAGDEREKTGGDEAIRFSHVSLTYPGAGAESLKDIDFTIRRGETVGIIGGTGSGKSSLLGLIARLYDATTGEVRVLGTPVEKWNREALREAVGMVPQKAQLFQGSVRSNLLWGNENATDEEMWKALEDAQAAEFVREMPGGLDAAVEQNGRSLSGGQRQRLTIARALVKKPKVLVLDDSFSALDFATDAALRRALTNLPWETTQVIVSQRASSLRGAQKILVLEEGRQVGWGDHESLLRDCPVYREIAESQFRSEEAEK